MSSSSDKKPGVLGRFLSQRGMGQVITVTIGLIVLCLVFGFINPNFFTYRNTANLLRQIAPTLLIGVGQSYVLFTGNIDLSIGSVVGMSCMISATLMCHGMNPWVAMVITLVVCLLVGYVNGWIKIHQPNGAIIILAFVKLVLHVLKNVCIPSAIML